MRAASQGAAACGGEAAVRAIAERDEDCARVAGQTSLGLQLRNQFNLLTIIFQRRVGRGEKNSRPPEERGRSSRIPCSFHAIVRGFSRNDDVVDVAFAEAGGGDADEASLLGELP